MSAGLYMVPPLGWCEGPGIHWQAPHPGRAIWGLLVGCDHAGTWAVSPQGLAVPGGSWHHLLGAARCGCCVSDVRPAGWPRGAKTSPASSCRAPSRCPVSPASCHCPGFGVLRCSTRLCQQHESPRLRPLPSLDVTRSVLSGVAPHLVVPANNFPGPPLPAVLAGACACCPGGQIGARSTRSQSVRALGGEQPARDGRLCVCRAEPRSRWTQGLFLGGCEPRLWLHRSPGSVASSELFPCPTCSLLCATACVAPGDVSAR